MKQSTKDALLKCNKELPVIIGSDTKGEPIIESLSTLKNILIVGDKSNDISEAIKTMVASLVMKSKPSQLKLVLMASKDNELSEFDTMYKQYAAFNNSDIIIGKKDFSSTLKQIQEEMDNRLAADSNNNPHIIVVIDDYGDFAEDNANADLDLVRVIAMCNLAGIHFIISTDHISDDVLTLTLRANCQTNLVFKTSDTSKAEHTKYYKQAENFRQQGEFIYRTPEQASSLVATIKTNITDFK